MNEFLNLKIGLACDMVSKGKPCASEPVQERYVKDIINKIKQEFNLKVYTEDLAEEWKTVWIYKDEYMLEIIKSLPEQPKTVLDHWVLGKAFGYSDEAIRIFLETKL